MQIFRSFSSSSVLRRSCSALRMVAPSMTRAFAATTISSTNTDAAADASSSSTPPLKSRRRQFEMNHDDDDMDTFRQHLSSTMPTDEAVVSEYEKEMKAQQTASLSRILGEHGILTSESLLSSLADWLQTATAQNIKLNDMLMAEEAAMADTAANATLTTKKAHDVWHTANS